MNGHTNIHSSTIHKLCDTMDVTRVGMRGRVCSDDILIFGFVSKPCNAKACTTSRFEEVNTTLLTDMSTCRAIIV